MTAAGSFILEHLARGSVVAKGPFWGVRAYVVPKD
jgi:hypothetical protein